MNFTPIYNIQEQGALEPDPSLIEKTSDVASMVFGIDLVGNFIILLDSYVKNNVVINIFLMLRLFLLVVIYNYILASIILNIYYKLNG